MLNDLSTMRNGSAAQGEFHEIDVDGFEVY